VGNACSRMEDLLAGANDQSSFMTMVPAPQRLTRNVKTMMTSSQRPVLRAFLHFLALKIASFFYGSSSIFWGIPQFLQKCGRLFSQFDVLKWDDIIGQDLPCYQLELVKVGNY
jgi:hypothetical protein